MRVLVEGTAVVRGRVRCLPLTKRSTCPPQRPNRQQCRCVLGPRGADEAFDGRRKRALVVVHDALHSAHDFLLVGRDA